MKLIGKSDQTTPGRILSGDSRRKLEQLSKRAKNTTLFGVAQDGTGWSEYCSKKIDDLLDWDKDPDKDPSEVMDLYKRAYSGDKDAQQELQGLRIESTMNYIVPSLRWAQFFEIVNLADNERPAVQNTTKQETGYLTVGQDDRKARELRLDPDTYEQLIPLSRVTTDEVEYPTEDIYLGDISRVSKEGFDLDFDLQNKLDGMYFLLLTGAIGVFDTTNAKKSRRAYNANSRIQAGVLPTSNAVSITGIGAGTTFGQTTIEAIVNYTVRFAGTSKDGDLRPTGEIVVPSLDVSGIISGISMTSAQQNDAAQQVLENGYFDLPKILGVNWRVVPDATLARKYCYPRLNKPAGKIFFKPGMSKDVETINQHLAIAKRFKSLVTGNYILEQNKPNLLQVRFTT